MQPEKKEKISGEIKSKERDELLMNIAIREDALKRGMLTEDLSKVIRDDIVFYKKLLENL